MMVRRAQPWLGTVVELAVEGEAVSQLHTAIDTSFARIAAIHRALSFQSPDSELTRLNRCAQRDWVAPSSDLVRVLAAALEFAHASAGGFDPTVAAHLLVSGHLPRHAGFPDAPVVDWQAIEFDGERVRFHAPVIIDLSGIAKGYAVDQALVCLRACGAVAASVNAGGDLARFGIRAAPVHLRLPKQPTAMLSVAVLVNGAIATSAGYFQPGHLRDPRDDTVLCETSSVSVLAADCLTADALTKAVAADMARAPALLARYCAQAVLLDPRGAWMGSPDGWKPLSLELAA
jgi:thiamine biosynthesis lipoprotein